MREAGPDLARKAQRVLLKITNEKRAEHPRMFGLLGVAADHHLLFLDAFGLEPAFGAA